MTRWTTVLEPLRVHVERGRPAVFPQHDPATPVLLDALEHSVTLTSIGQFVAQVAHEPHDVLEHVRAINEPTVLTDFDVLFHPMLATDVPALLKQHSRRAPLVAAWPGTVRANRLTYSAAGRADYVDAPATGFVILHPRATTFPDEVPYRMEIA